jgi:ABC-type phosphate transport system substrate-binding protein
MTKQASISIAAIGAAFALTTAGAGAAPTPLYSGGGTAMEKVYRDLFNAYGNTASGDLCIGRPNCPTFPYNSAVEILYVGVGSGNAQKAIDANDPSLLIVSNKKPDAVPVGSTRDFGPFYGTGTGASWVPAASGPYYPKLSFAGTDNTLSSTDITTAAATSLGNNPLTQFPMLVEVVDVAFNPSANWQPAGVQPSGGSSKVQLSTNTLCGIFTGNITSWDDPLITKDNGGIRLGTGQITVVYRNDSAGSTFLFTNALINQCGVTAATGITPVQTRSAYPIPGQWLIDNKITAYSTSAPHYKSGTSFFINVFQAGHLPANFYNDNGGASGVVGGASGTGGVQKIILATTGSIGYISPDFAQPVDAAGPQAANLQTYATFSAGKTPVYRAPTAANGAPIMAHIQPPTAAADIQNPLKWGALNPIPTSVSAYPIGGFTFIDLRRCFTSADDVQALVGKKSRADGFFTWYFGPKSVNGGAPAAILANNGYAPVPAPWPAAINSLLTGTATGLNVPGSGACAGVTAGA